MAPISKDRHGLSESAAVPLVQAVLPENMASYFARVQKELDSNHFEVVKEIVEEGLYIGKRPIIGAQGQGQLLNQAGTVFYHTLLYLKSGDQVTALDFGPVGSADVTTNVMEAAPCGSVVHEGAVPDAGQPLVRIKLPSIGLDSGLARKAIAFVQSRQYHAINNNCIHNTDFLCRVLTLGALRNGPLVYDALAGSVPKEDHPMLLMFFLMTQLSWFHVVDGSPLTAQFMESEGIARVSGSPLEENGTAVKCAADTCRDEERLQEKQVDLTKGMLQGSQAQHKGTSQ